MWHWIFAYANFSWIQSLFREPRDGGKPILKSRHRLTGEMVTRHLKYIACELSKASKQKSVTKDPLPRGKGRKLQLKIRKKDLDPGQRASIDQYQSSTPGRRLGSRGKEKKKYCGGTLFYDHGTTYIFICHQVSLNAGETVMSKEGFEQVMAEVGRKVQSYHTDNAPFQSKTFRDSLNLENQSITFSGIGAHHQNGVVEREIKTICMF